MTAALNASTSTRAAFDVVVDDFVAEGLARHRAGVEQVGRLGERGRHPRPRRPRRRCPRRPAASVELLLDAAQAGGDEGRDREVGIDVAAGDPALEAKRRAVADDAKRAGAVVEAPQQRGRREGAGDEALVAVDVRREQERRARASRPAGRRGSARTRREPCAPSPAKTGAVGRRVARGGCGTSCPRAASYLAMKVRL